MSFRQVLYCDECNRPIILGFNEDEKDYAHGYKHAHHKCHQERWGFSKGSEAVKPNA